MPKQKANNSPIASEDALEKLQNALDLINEARGLIREAAKNPSLANYYGYSLTITMQQLDKFGSNEAGYGGHNTSLYEIIDEYGQKWADNLEEDENIEEPEDEEPKTGECYGCGATVLDDYLTKVDGDNYCGNCVQTAGDFDPDDRDDDDSDSGLSYTEQCWQDRNDLANEIARTDPERAAEIRAGA